MYYYFNREILSYLCVENLNYKLSAYSKENMFQTKYIKEEIGNNRT